MQAGIVVIAEAPSQCQRPARAKCCAYGPKRSPADGPARCLGERPQRVSHYAGLAHRAIPA